jgi:hypothetical protein
MTLNWGHKIILVFVAFVAMMVTLVYKSMHTEFDLVSKEYYKEELGFQKVIDARNNASKLSSQIKIRQTESQVIISLPAEMKDKIVKGDVQFYCPTRASNDKKVGIQMDAEGEIAFNKEQFTAAPYIVKVSWEADGVSYYGEEGIQIN